MNYFLGILTHKTHTKGKYLKFPTKMTKRMGAWIYVWILTS